MMTRFDQKSNVIKNAIMIIYMQWKAAGKYM